MTTSDPDRTVGAGLPTIRDEVLRSQLRPVIALAFTAALLVGSAILGQYAWLRLQATNPLDEIDAAELRQVLRSASLDQWPVLTRWVAAFGLGMTVGPGDDVPAGQARLPDGRQVPLADVLCLVVDGQRVEPASGRLLGPAPANWQAAIARMAESATLRLGPTDSADGAGPQSWPALLLRLDPGRVAVVASPNFAFAPSELARLVLLFAALTAAAVAAFVALFLLAFRRRFAARSAERLSAPVERLAAAVRMATADSAAARRVVVEPPAEVAQLAADFNRMQEHLAQALAERERVIDGQRELVAALSHELRTPLAVLRGHAELLSRAASSAAAAQVMLRQIEDLHRLLSDLLDMARLESIEATLVREDVALDAVMDEMIERFGAAAWRQGVVLRAAPTSERRLVARADTRWLRQIVANLLSNAIRHTPPGGLVTLAAQRRGQQVRLIIEDTGNGLDAARVQHDPADRPAGIGLRVVRRLIAAMRGHLILEATDEGGTRATVQLPTATGQPA
ncbi:MAG: HAMP domain-containing histidine kinase [Burkholderiales bacterium]|nr:HAMP domain-containing histidine kinase [Burkholderiales bacterium]